MNGYLALIKEQRNENDNLQQEIERLHSIIKEVREYIKNMKIFDIEQEFDIDKLLEILDKENNNE